MNVVKQAFDIAKKELRDCYGEQGIYAGLHQFKDHWARDSFFASYGALAIKDYKIVKENLLHFLNNRGKDNQIPLRIGKTAVGIALSYFGIRSVDFTRLPIFTSDKSHGKPLDQNSLFIISAYEYVKNSKDGKFLMDNILDFEKIILWNFTHADDLLIEEKYYCNWADSVKKRGKVLYTNVCHCHALNSMGKLFLLAKDKKKSKKYLNIHAKVKKKINELFWSGEHYLDWIDQDITYNYFSTDGNILAILWDIADNAKSKHIEEASHIFDINDVPSQCVHPNYPINLISVQIRMLGLKDYHNGLSWIWLGCINALAKQKLGMKQEAKEILERIAGLIIKYNGVYEIYEKTGKPVRRWIYKAEQPFAWSSGLFVYATKSIYQI